jgi:NTE family protein
MSYLCNTTVRRPTLLAETRLFRDVPEKVLRRLEFLARARTFEAGKTIISEGHTAIAVFMVISGRVQVSVRTHNGENSPIRTIGPGGTFGEMALFSQRPRSASVTAITRTECLALDRLDFLDFLRGYPNVAIRLADNLVQLLYAADHRA